MFWTPRYFSAWWAPIYILDNLSMRLYYLIQGKGYTYLQYDTFEGY